MTRFSEWWRRSRRTGHAYAQVAALHGKGEERYFVRDCRRVWFWGLVLPVVALGLAAFTRGWSLLLLGAYALQFARIYFRGRKRGWAGRDAFDLCMVHGDCQVSGAGGNACVPLAASDAGMRLADHRIQRECMKEMTRSSSSEAAGANDPGGAKRRGWGWWARGILPIGTRRGFAQWRTWNWLRCATGRRRGRRRWLRSSAWRTFMGRSKRCWPRTGSMRCMCWCHRTSILRRRARRLRPA